MHVLPLIFLHLLRIQSFNNVVVLFFLLFLVHIHVEETLHRLHQQILIFPRLQQLHTIFVALVVDGLKNSNIPFQQNSYLLPIRPCHLQNRTFLVGPSVHVF